MTNGPDNGDSDLDRTDELPILSEESIVRMRAAYRDASPDGEIPASEHDVTAVGPAAPDDTTVMAKAGPVDDERQTSRLERDIADLNARWRAVEALLSESSDALASLQAELAANREALDQSRADEQRLVRDLEAERAAAAGLRERLEQADAARIAAAKELDALRQAARSELVTARQSAENDLDEARRAAAALTRERDEAATRLAERTATLDETKERLGTLEAELDALRAAQVSSGTELDALKAARVSSLDERQALEAAVAALTAERDDALAKAAEAVEQATARETMEVDQSLRARIAELESYIAGRRDRWFEMEATVAERGERIREFEDELRYRVERQAELEDELSTARAGAETLRRELERLRLTARADSADAARAAAAMRLASAPDAAAVAELEQRLARANSMLGRLEDAFDSSAAATSQPGPEAPSAAAAAAAGLHPVTDEAATPDRAGTSGPDRVAVADTAQESATGPALIALTSDTKRHNELVKDTTTIGRGSECDIRILTHFISRLHAVVRRENGEMIIEDQGSTNGIFVNSVRVQKSALQDGDWVTIGETQFRFVANTAPG